MTANQKQPSESTGEEAPACDDQELLEWRDLQNAQIDSMQHVWDNPEDEVWNDA